MKKTLLTTVVLAVLVIGQLRAQGPTISMVGSSPSFSKGNINTEILTQIIQQKQEEVKRRVFRNTVIEGFNKATFASNLKNFTTYHYLYNVMDVLTSGKNKTAMTKAIVESSTEFVYVFGLALYVTKVKDQLQFGTMTIDASIFKNAERNVVGNELQKPTDVKTFNMVIDICYDVILNDWNLQRKFKFKDDLSDNNFETWYNSDNCYRVASIAFDSLMRNYKEPEFYQNVLSQFGLFDKKEFKKLRSEQNKADLSEEQKAYLVKQRKGLEDLHDGIKKHLEDLAKMSDAIQGVVEGLKTIKADLNNDGFSNTVNGLLSSLADMPATELKVSIERINSDYAALLTDAQKSKISAIAGSVTQHYDQYRQLIQFYVGLEKSEYKDFSLTKDQYYAMKYVLLEFLGFAKNQFDNHVAASVLDFLIENTIVEYADRNDHPKPEENAGVTDKGYLYIDVESLIAAVDQHYNPGTRKSSVASKRWYINPRPFISIGTNYASFFNSNSLSTNNDGTPESLEKLYFASEKIGLRIKFFDKRYSRAFRPGEKFSYKGTDRVWLRPQKVATVSDVHLMVYVSGLLYNIIDIKSNENFNYAVAGTGLGITFFNGLSANIGAACPFTDNKFSSRNSFFNIGFDIPIIEYIAALSKKS